MTVKGQHIKAPKAPCIICGKVMTKPGLVGHLQWKHGKDYKAPLSNVPKPMSFGEAKHKAKLFDQVKLDFYQSMQELFERIQSGKELIRHFQSVGDTKTVELLQRHQAEHERHYRLFKERLNKLYEVEPKQSHGKPRDTLVWVGEEVFLR